MTGIFAHWLPILLASILVFFASSVIHMGPFWHKGDFSTVPNETQLRAALRPFDIPPGDYCVPRPASSEDMKSPEFAQKVLQGPNIVMTVMPNAPWSMGRNLGLWLLYCVAASIFAAYVTVHAVPSGVPYGELLRFSSTTAFIAYAVALWQMSIWYRRAWSVTLKATLDGLIYAGITAVTFGWLWPR
ncbi:MAG: hypothetical protein ABI119_14675 [Gemmatimonadaceae bacterium]